MDPFQSPETDTQRQTGSLDVGLAVSEAVGAAMANIVAAIGVVIVATIAFVVGICTCVGWIPVLPVLSWGSYSWMLEALDGEARVSTLWSGLQRFGDVFVRMWGFFLLWFLVSLPLTGVMLVAILPSSLEAAARGEQPDPVMQAVTVGVASLIFALLVVRLMIAPFFIVERGLGPIEAFQRSWEVTTGQWGKLIVLQLLLTLISIPSQVLNVGLQVFSQSIDQTDPQAAMDALPIVLGLYSAMFTLSAAAFILGQLFFASAYRQLSGPAPAE